MDIEQFLDNCQGNIITISPLSKIPQHDGWLVSPSPYPDTASASVALDLGYNLGLRIPVGTLVIDVDPKNGGEESFKKLPDDVRSLPTTTLTPSGGRHIYTALPEGTEYRLLRTTLKEDFPGIDFLHYGRQVLLPGSTLGSTLNYTIDPDATFPPPTTPDSLLSILKRPETSEHDSAPSGYLTNGELYQLLQTIPVTEYDDNDSWLQVLMASHHATSGEGLEAFLAWSLEDPKYVHEEQMIRSRWQSASVDKENPITGRTLCRIVKKHNGHVPVWLGVKVGLVESPDNIFNDETIKDANTAVSKYRAIISGATSYEDLIPHTLYSIVTDSTILESHREMLIQEISKKTGASMAALRKDIKGMTKEVSRRTEKRSLSTVLGNITVDDSQVNLRVAHALIERVAEDYHDVPPTYYGGRWWVWTGSHWSNELGESDIERKALRTIQSFGIKVTSQMARQAVEIARIELAGLVQSLYPDPNEISIFTQNKVLKYDKNGHGWKVSNHDPSNKNPYILNCVFDPDAPEPFHWHQFLNQVVSSDHARRTLACAIIYAAGGAVPWLRKFFFFYGPPRTGKSTTLDFIEALLGKENCSALNLHQLSGRFGASSLVSKLANISNETISKKAFNDDIFKAVVSGESITVEQKHQDPFAFRNRAKCLFAANGFPRIEDESEGVWDRLVLFSFRKETPYEQADHTLHQKLLSERSGVLNWALQIFREEYQKDECRSIMTPDAAAQEDIEMWRRTNNPALQWVRERLTETRVGSDIVTIDEAYADYVIWAKNDGHYRQAKNAFSRVVSRVLKTDEGGRDRRKFLGVRVQPLAYFENLNN
jgi:P4 family phage/plasmid primase-like protien